MSAPGSAEHAPEQLAEPGQRRPLVAVCVTTFRRLAGLRRLVESLIGLQLADIPARIELNIVDNDAGESARATCDELRARARFPVKYEVEPRRGIPQARNRSVGMIDPAAEFVAFVDDDETVEPDWLGQLLSVQRKWDADVVAGPVVPEFPREPPAWMVRGRFMELARHATGERLDRAFTGNVLVRVELLQRMGTLFDERLALSGGSDTLFFRRVHRAGFKIVWADGAVVHERVPPSRMSARWILRRAYRYGVMTPTIERAVRPGWVATVSLAAVGCYRMVKGLVFLPLTWPLGRHMPVTYLRHICYGAGMLAGLLGMRYNEYDQTHGD